MNDTAERLRLKRIMLGAVLHNMREERGLKQYEAANLLGRSQSFISAAEKGRRRFDVVELRDYCKALGFPILEVVMRMVRGLDAMDA